MKMKRLNKVLNIVVTLMAAIALMLGNVTSVAAYTADSTFLGYPFVFPDMSMEVYGYPNGGFTQLGKSKGIVQDDYGYTFSFDSLMHGVQEIRLGNMYNEFIFPYDPDSFNYYVVGSFGYARGNDAFFEPSTTLIRSFNDNGSLASDIVLDVDYYNFNTDSLTGFSFAGQLNLVDSTAFSYLTFTTSSTAMILSDSVYFTASIIPVSKNADYTSVMNSILQALNQINQNLITNNTLQQQTIDAINQNTTNASNWFTTLITTMQGWYNTQTENLRTWFYMIEERMSAGFTALYHQMTKEQDEKLNGYDDTTQSDAADNFNTESDKLTQLEDQLNDQSHGFVSDYTTTGFNTGVLTTLSSSLIFVTTWFANFWNMGGIFTAGLNLCFSLSIVFFILRLRR